MPGEDPRQAGKAVSGGNRDSGTIAPFRAGSRARRWPSVASKRVLGASSAASALVAGLAHAQETAAAAAGLLVQHGRGDAARDVCRRHGRGAPLRDLPHPRAGKDGGRESRVAQPRRRPQCGAPALRCAAQPARPARDRVEQRQEEARADRHAARRKRRPRRARRVPGFRPLADAALGGGARERDRGPAREGGRLSTSSSRR